MVRASFISRSLGAWALPTAPPGSVCPVSASCKGDRGYYNIHSDPRWGGVLGDSLVTQSCQTVEWTREAVSLYNENTMEPQNVDTCVLIIEMSLF